MLRIDSKYPDLLYLVIISIVAMGFFYKTIFFGLLPVPSDSLVGLYHPWRDYYAVSYPRGMPFKNSLITDPVRQQIPWKKLVINSWKQGKIPFWNPTTFSGMPLAANIQSGSFYPLNIIFMFFDFPVAWTILIILEPLLSGYFIYFFIRNSDETPFAALLGSILWMFSGFSVAWLTWGTITHVSLWLPLILLSVNKIIKGSLREIKVWWGIFVIANLMQVLAGHAQISFYIFGITMIYTFWQLRKANRVSIKLLPKIILIIFGYLLILLVAWVQLKPLIQLFDESSRISSSNWMINGWFLPWQNLIQFIIPDFFGNPATMNYWGIWNYGEFIGYIGIVGIILAINGIVSELRTNNKFWLISLLISLILILPNPVSIGIFQIGIPLLSSFQPTRLMVIIDFCLVIMAVKGFSAFVSGKSDWLKLVLIIFSVLWFGLIIFLVKSPAFVSGTQLLANLQISKRNIIFPTGIFIVIIGLVYLFKSNVLNLSGKKMLPLILFFLVVSDLFRFGWKFTPFTSQKLFFPETKSIMFLEKKPKPFRVMTVDDRVFAPNTLAYYGINSLSGYDPLYLKRYEEFVAAMERGKPNILGPFGFNRIITPKNIQSPLFKILNPKYVVSLSDLNDSRFKLVFSEGLTKIYENTSVLPRAFFVNKVKYVENKQAVMDELYSDGFNPSSEVVIEKQIKGLNYPIGPSETVTLINYNNDELLLKTFSISTHYLFIGNIYDQNWKAYIDNQTTEILPTDYTFMGLIVPKGIHQVRLIYKPDIL